MFYISLAVTIQEIKILANAGVIGRWILEISCIRQRKLFLPFVVAVLAWHLHAAVENSFFPRNAFPSTESIFSCRTYRKGNICIPSVQTESEKRTLSSSDWAFCEGKEKHAANTLPWKHFVDIFQQKSCIACFALFSSANCSSFLVPRCIQIVAAVLNDTFFVVSANYSSSSLLQHIKSSKLIFPTKN